MPIDGNQQSQHQQQQQHIYGAQHPHSLKLIKELANTSSTNQINTGSSLITSSSSSSSSSNTGVLKAYKDYEKKTIDAWDIDEDECFNYSLNDPFPISIIDSDQVAKKIIKDHQEKTTKSSQQSKQTNLNNSQLKSNGPGKALRQQDLYTSDNLENNFKSIKINNLNLNNNQSTNIIESNDLNDLNESKLNDLNMINNSININTNNNNNTLNSNINQSNFKYLTNRDSEEDLSRMEKFKQILNSNPINLVDLEKISWKGIPKVYRAICWKLLSDYLPLKKELQEKTIEQKRNSYWESVSECYSPTFLELNHETLRQILNDIPRMNPLISIFQNETVQNIFQRVLYVWAVRHPGSGYVQGINDLLTPFFVVFLADYVEFNNYTDIQAKDIEKLSKEILHQLEADCYWCMTKLLDRIQENYVFSQPGIQRKIIALEELMKRIDLNLYNHLKRNNIEFIQFAFRWMNNLLMREIPLSCTIRLWDTYHAEPFGFSDFHLYVCAAFLSRYSKLLSEEKDFQGLMLLLQSLPTRNLKTNDITLLTAEAYKLQVMFANSPNHTSTK